LVIAAKIKQKADNQPLIEEKQQKGKENVKNA
jgi:hypothetical protein